MAKAVTIYVKAVMGMSCIVKGAKRPEHASCIIQRDAGIQAVAERKRNASKTGG